MAEGEPPRLLAALLVARVVRLVDMVLKGQGGRGRGRSIDELE